MANYLCKSETFKINHIDFQIETLLDRCQFYDPLGVAKALGIDDTSWPIFGLLWPSGHILAEELSVFPIEGKSVLEIGCGIGLASLVAHQRHANITVTDYHPMVETFLLQNLKNNKLPPMSYYRGNWFDRSFELGQFDLIIASDVLYLKELQEILPQFIDRHLKKEGEIMIADPGRQQDRAFNRAMNDLGYSIKERKTIYIDRKNNRTQIKIYNYKRCF